jgi:hypothetical protein
LVDSTINCWSADNVHPSPEGTYLAACTIYSTFTQRRTDSATYTGSFATADTLQLFSGMAVFDSGALWNYHLGGEPPFLMFTHEHIGPDVLTKQVQLLASIIGSDSSYYHIWGNAYGPKHSGFPLTYRFDTMIAAHGVDTFSLPDYYCYYHDSAILTGISHCGTRSSFFNYVDIICEGIDEVNASTAFNLAPNPAKNMVQIQLAEMLHSSATLKIYNLQGMLIREEHVEAGKQNINLDISNLPAAVYQIQMSTEKYSHSKRLIVQ